jgi:hypothetical protein
VGSWDAGRCLYTVAGFSKTCIHVSPDDAADAARPEDAPQAYTT